MENVTNDPAAASLHIQAGEIAKVVLMPGDPLRAKYVAERYLENPVCFNTIRNMFGYTGTYKGRKLTVMGSGMGVPSISLYARELFGQRGVEAILRIGSTGGLLDEVKMRDIVIAMGASTDSNYSATLGLPGQFAPVADYGLLSTAVEAAQKLGITPKVGPVYTSDTFYFPTPETTDKARQYGHLAIEMETAGLYWTAAACGKKALSILTVSDHLYTGGALTPEERQTTFHQMMEVALETAWQYAE